MAEMIVDMNTENMNSVAYTKKRKRLLNTDPEDRREKKNGQRMTNAA